MPTKEQLKELQALSLEEKIQVSTARIIEWYETWGGQVYVSFSGGKDSTVLLDLVRRAYPEVTAVFVDTGLEFPEIREFVKSIDNVVWLKPKMNFVEVIKKYGYPLISKEVSLRIYQANHSKTKNTASWKMLEGRYKPREDGKPSLYNISKWKFLLEEKFNMSNFCCEIMKKKPAHDYEKISKLHPYVGTMTHESLSRKNNWLKNGCNAFNKKILNQIH